MKTLLFGFMMLFLCCACGNSKSDSRLTDEAALSVDSALTDSLQIDSVEMRALTLHIDQTFDDFVYAYTHDDRIQLFRTRFPLPFLTDSINTLIPRSEWIHDHLYTNEEYYHLLFDKEEDMDLEKEPDVDRVYVAWLYLNRKVVRRYYFKRDNKGWELESIKEHSLQGNPNEDFLDFFYRFCNDSVYQREHVQSPLKFITSDPEDDFRVIEASIDADQWSVFRPVLPVDRMTNINYGQKYDPRSRTKIVAFRSIGSGYSNTLFFTRRGKTWMLSAYEDLSN